MDALAIDADQVSKNLIATAGVDRDSGGAVARDEIPLVRKVAANQDSKLVLEQNAVLRVGQGQAAGNVGSDEIPDEDMSARRIQGGNSVG